ncbi:MAG: thermonuclease family protein [Pseudonocardiaceae bacterium]
MRLPMLVLALLLTQACSPTPAAAAERRLTTDVARTATVSRVVDGDTFTVVGAGGGIIKVRVLGIDTPETKDPRKPVQCWGPEASRWAAEQLQGRQVTLSTDPTQAVRDYRGRLLAYVDRDGWDYSVEAARAGMARAYIYDRPVQRAALIADAEREARAGRRGLWGPPCEGGVAR